MKNLREKIEIIVEEWLKQFKVNNKPLLIFKREKKELATEIEAIIKPLIEALEAADDHLRKSVEEAEGCPYDNCFKHSNGSISCKYEECIHYHAGDLISKALKEFKDNEEDR